ncbi:MAG: branched-chain amino acid transport system substrate-binding protein [Solirubrobacteraceae bacterium]|nr:branched-chain amino acid transport system substrate-binding protein [Solirubrobacteraceae bacterium]
MGGGRSRDQRRADPSRLRLRLGPALGCVFALFLLAVSLSACANGNPDDGGPESGPRTLTIYSSLPLHGPDRERSRDMVNAIKLALEESNGKIGPLSITYVSLDSATAEQGTWTKDSVLDNARQAVRDPNTIAYIGDLESAATALALPLTNEGHILHISPSSTYVGLTRASRRQGEPERFYPAGRRTFGRMVPTDHVQASALVGYMKEEGVRSLALMADRDLDGGGLADQIATAAAGQGMTVSNLGQIDPQAVDLSGPAAKVAQAGADAFLFAGVPDAGAARVFSAVAAAAPNLLLFAPGAGAEGAFAQALPAAVQRRMRLTSPTLPPRLLPASARAFRARFRAAVGRYPVPEALQAYEATNVILSSIRSAGAMGNNRLAVVDKFFATRDRPSVLGKYTIDRFGDTSLSTYAGDRLRRSRLVLDTVLKVRP